LETSYNSHYTIPAIEDEIIIKKKLNCSFFLALN